MFGQTNFPCFYKTLRLSWRICILFWGTCLPFLAHFWEVFFDILEECLELSQLFKIEFFSKIVDAFEAMAIFAKRSNLNVNWVLHLPTCYKHINNHFHQIYL